MDNKPQRWRAHAACHGHDTNLFFPTRGDNNQQITEAKQICFDCPVINECREYALGFEHHLLPGIYGGLTQLERRRIRKATA